MFFRVHGDGITSDHALPLQTVVQRLEALVADLSPFLERPPKALPRRFREDSLGLTASSLTFTTILALVPFLPWRWRCSRLSHVWQAAGRAAALAARQPGARSIARQVLGYLTQFSAGASRLGLLGFSMLLATALALILTIDRTLNNIWRVRRLRPLGQRVLIYWAAITLGPLLLGPAWR